MSTHSSRTPDEWARVIANAYAAKTRPPLTRKILDEVQAVIAEGRVRQ